LFAGRQNPWMAAAAISALILTCALVPAASASQASADSSSAKPHKTTTAKTGAKSSSAVHSTSSKHKKKSKKVRGQQKIDSERAQQIQEALIRQHYLTGEATGTWNEASEAAMRRFQADNGWQSKTVPDSRALIKLGLGPSKDHLLNPESAMTTVPDAPKSEPLPTTSNTPPATAAPTTPASTNSSIPQ
jgi:peptidoglycan hydrolase-like protein with peptidoglycan-binding domain